MIQFIPFFVLVYILHFQATAAQYNNYLSAKCNGSTYAVNSTYQANLKTLLSSLTAKSSSSLYNNATVSGIYGLYLCQGDLSPADCQTYVKTAATEITDTGKCPHYRQAVIWYDYCMLRYSDANFFGVPDTDVSMILNDEEQSITSLVPYQMVSNLVQVAPFRTPMFASDASTITSTYAMAQCTNDLSRAGCSQCLNTILSSIKGCCITLKGWRELSNSCSISTYQTNLNTLFSSLTAKSSTYNSATIGTSANRIYGLYVCWGDMSPADCQTCVQSAATATESCPSYRQAVIRYDCCMLRYLDAKIFGVSDTHGFTMWNPDKSSTSRRKISQGRR